MDVSRSTYFKVVDGDNRVVAITSNAEEAILSLPFGGEIFFVERVVFATSRLITTTIAEEVLDLN